MDKTLPLCDEIIHVPYFLAFICQMHVQFI